MNNKILFFFPLNPYPPLGGANQRCFDILNSLKKLNCEVYFLSADFTSDRPWDPVSIEHIKQNLAEKVYIYRINLLDRIYNKIIHIFYKIVYQEPPFNTRMHTPPFMRFWFYRVFKKVKPRIIFMNYVYWERLASSLGNTVKIIDTHDLAIANMKMRKLIMSNDNKYVNIHTAKNLDTADNISECKIYDRYDYTLAISPHEAEEIKKYTKKTIVQYIPAIQHRITHKNNYSGPALFTSGFNNPFNTYGIKYFIKNILPRINAEKAGFNMSVAGKLYGFDMDKEIIGINFIGIIENLSKTYEHAGFFISPVFIGTGQQVKVMAAMANGLPVVMFRSGLRGEPIIHGKTGYLAESDREFAHYCLKLWNDRNLCAALGSNAATFMEKNYSFHKLAEGLSKLINPRV